MGTELYNTSASVVRDLGIYLDSDVSMRSHVAKTVAACFAVLRQLRSVRRSLPRPVLQLLMSSVVLSRLDYGSATLAGIPCMIVSSAAAPVGPELGCVTRVLFVEV